MDLRQIKLESVNWTNGGPLRTLNGPSRFPKNARDILNS